MIGTELRQPNEIAQELRISPSTLRRWSTEFARFLSESAGRPEPSAQGEPAHRRYTSRDMAILSTVGDLLRKGLTYRQITAHLERAQQITEQAEQNEVADVRAVVGPLPSPNTAITPAFSIISDTLQTVIEGQETVLSSQQANRELLGVVIQDNFNLKEENARLRERMLQLEREMSEFRRREDNMRLEITERLHEMDNSKDRNPDTGERRGCLAALLGL
jgi:DNA-binding transcriptional MerR regulator